MTFYYRCSMKTKTAILLIPLLLLIGCGKPDQPTVSLYLAIQRGDIDQIERHISWGADINRLNIDGRRPLHVAAERGRIAITRLLIRNGADPNATDSEGHTPIHSALMNGRTQIADLLIKQGANYDPSRLLHQAVEKGVEDRDVIRFVLTRGGDINQPDDEGVTPLAKAIRGDYRVLVKFLIAAGADVNAPNRSGELQLQLAQQMKNPDIVRLLKRNGAKIPDKP